ncbi:MAG TPA: glycoside hydrolase family 2 TIM barrel-domain containing protein, partial [Phnomibacter sp.]|nr:glycoside hydrolase family 2 TIM barrel-domain containing protein [Phnomibacter sp.]
MKYFFSVWFLVGVLTIGINVSAVSREKISLNAGWDFVLNDKSDLSSLQGNVPWQRLNLPHTWNALDIVDEPVGYHRGIGWYQRALFVDNELRGKSVRLYFEGACIKTTLFVNGQRVGVHQGGYTGFIFDITPYVQYGQNNLVQVQVDNSRHLSDSIPPVTSDFNQMGGIYRDVWLITTNPIFFEHEAYGGMGIDFKTPMVNDRQASFNITAHFKGLTGRFNGIISYTLSDRNSVVKSANLNLGNFSGKSFEWKDNLANPKLWSPETPNLYQLKVQLYSDKRELLDEVVVNVGFKWVGIGPNQEFMLNGKPYKLKGASRHQDYHQLGFALTDAMHLRDMKLMKEMGCNFIRIAHYPQDPAIFNACNELGLISWCEIPVVDKVTPGEAFSRNTEVMMREMITQNANHPSIAIWGYHNEVRNLDTASLRNARMLNGIAKTMDPARLTAIAFESNLDLPYFKNPLLTDMLGIADINGYNVYQGWYRGKHENIRQFLDTLHNYYPAKPILLSEYGAGSIVNIHTHQPTLFDFSEEYQCAFHESYVKAGNEVPWMTGFAIWNFIDFQRDGREDVVPHINKKGMVTTDRRYKDAFYFYKSQWSNEPFVYLTGKHWPERLALVGQGLTSTTIPVVVYSNQKNLTLSANGKSLGALTSANGRFEWQVPVTPGMNDLVCSTTDGSLTDVLNIRYRFIDTTSIGSDLSDGPMHFNTGQSRTFFTDLKSREQWMPDKPYHSGSWGYVGGSIWNTWPSPAWNGTRQGIHKPIRNTDNEPLFQTFVQDLTAWRADVPDGKYRVSILMSEPFTENQRNKIDRILDVSLNGKVWQNQLNLAKDHGIQTAVIFDKEIIVANGGGITIGFSATSGKTILNG